MKLSWQKLSWQKHGDVLVGVDDGGWKRAVILFEKTGDYYGYGPLGFDRHPIEEFIGKNKRDIKQRIQRVVDIAD